MTSASAPVSNSRARVMPPVMPALLTSALIGPSSRCAVSKRRRMSFFDRDVGLNSRGTASRRNDFRDDSLSRRLVAEKFTATL